MHNALPQPGKKCRTVQRVYAVGRSGRVGVVKEDQIEIRAVPQFNAAELTVTNNQKSCRFTLCCFRVAMPFHKLVPG